MRNVLDAAKSRGMRRESVNGTDVYFDAKGRAYAFCDFCGKLVRLDGLFSSLHLCVPIEDRYWHELYSMSTTPEQLKIDLGCR